MFATVHMMVRIHMLCIGRRPPAAAPHGGPATTHAIFNFPFQTPFCFVTTHSSCEHSGPRAQDLMSLGTHVLFRSEESKRERDRERHRESESEREESERESDGESECDVT